jgi:hypothetical protein
MLYYPRYLLVLILLFTFSGHGFSSESRAPSVYAVHQQQGRVCPFISWENLTKVRHMRARGGGHIVLEPGDFSSKLKSYAWFLPQIHALDKLYDKLRAREGTYAAYEQAIREDGIRSNQRFTVDGVAVDAVDLSPLEQAKRAAFSPYNILVDDLYSLVRWLPILQNSETNELGFYDYKTGKVTPLDEVKNLDPSRDVTLTVFEDNREASLKYVSRNVRFEQWMLQAMGVTLDEIALAISENGFLGFKTGFYLASSVEEELTKEYFFDVGTYQHMLFACGVKSDNTSFSKWEKTPEAQAWRELSEAMKSEPLNPWRDLDKEDLFEYQLAQIFKTHRDLKDKAASAVDYYNNYWQIYLDSKELYDRPEDPRKQLSKKPPFMPGTEQMLAYVFSNQLRFLWAATIGEEAVRAVESLEERMSWATYRAYKASGHPLRTFKTADILKTAGEKKFGTKYQKYSFLELWAEIKGWLQSGVMQPRNIKDFVTFSNHGSVISFDEDLVGLQKYESREVAEALGFVTWDSLYDRALTPFYRKPGGPEDVIEF